jgi:hypothetical protein
VRADVIVDERRPPDHDDAIRPREPSPTNTRNNRCARSRRLMLLQRRPSKTPIASFSC